MSYQAIADHIVAVAEGQQTAMVPSLRASMFCQSNYRISMQAVHRAYRRASVSAAQRRAAELLARQRARTNTLAVASAGYSAGRSAQHRSLRQVLGNKAEAQRLQVPARSIDRAPPSALWSSNNRPTRSHRRLGRLTIEEFARVRAAKPGAGVPEVIEIEATRRLTRGLKFRTVANPLPKRTAMANRIDCVDRRSRSVHS